MSHPQGLDIVLVIVYILCPLMLILTCFDPQFTNGNKTSAPIDQLDELKDEFAHLVQRASHSNRVHLISEIVQYGKRIQVEEFLDLKTYNQLIQFKWNEPIEASSVGNDRKNRLKPYKINVIVFNEQDNKVMVQYKPFECLSFVLNTKKIDSLDWQSFIEQTSVSNNFQHNHIVESIKMAAKMNPYLAQIPLENHGEAWVFGVSGLWLNAQYAGNKGAISRPSHVEDGYRFIDSEAWRLELAGTNLLLDYYQESGLLNGFKSLQQSKNISNAQFDVLNLVEIKNSTSGQTIQLVNVIDVNFYYNDRLARDLFTLPIGFNCPENPLINRNRLYFRQQTSQLMEIELVATRFKPASSESSHFIETNIKNIEIAYSKHPIDSQSHVAMFHFREQRIKVIKDFYLNLKYFIRLNGTSQHCEISHINLDQNQPKIHNYPIELMFSNGITLTISRQTLDFIFMPDTNEMQRMRLINKIQVSDNKHEYVFESDVVGQPFGNIASVLHLVSPHGYITTKKLTIVRVYEQKALTGRTDMLGLPKTKPRGGMLALSRVLLLVFDHDKREKLAELRFNLNKDLQTMSFTRKAQTFDLSSCYDLAKESVQLVATYPIDSNLFDYLEENEHELIERFYSSYIDWLTLSDQNVHRSALEKKRLALSLNFLRMPKVELRRLSSGELELSAFVLDEISPLYRFEQISKSTFVIVNGDEQDQQVLLVESRSECANYCRQFHCKIFAYDSSMECKLSHLKLEDRQFSDEQTDEDGQMQFETQNKSNNKTTVKLLTKSLSQVFYEPEYILEDKKLTQAANLADISSYLEHFSNDLEDFATYNSETEEDDSTSTRIKRSLPVEHRPLFAFDFVDRSNLINEYSPPKTRLLVPSQVRTLKLPIYFDVGEQSRLLKVAKSFTTHVVGKCYSLYKLNSMAHEPKFVLEHDERTIVDQDNQVYLTLKRLHSIDMDNCALICYNTEEFNSNTGGEQICTEFSYHNFDKECIMLIRTDFKYVESKLDLVYEADTVDKLNSTDELFHENADCILAKRNYLSEFNGPIKLAAEFFGSKTTESIDFGLDFEWRQIFTDDSIRMNPDMREMCSSECISINRQGKLCLAFDFCSTVSLGYSGEKRYVTTCNSLLIDLGGEVTRLSEDFSNKIHRMRSHLIRETSPEKSSASQRSDNRVKSNTTIRSNCDRYLLSHLHNFNHLRQRQISEELLDKLERPNWTLKGQNLDACALDCYLKSSRCLGFQYCMSVIQGASGSMQTVSSNCSLFGRPLEATKIYFEANGDEVIGGDNVNRTVSPGKRLTVYNKDCHVYVKNHYDSLEQILKLGPITPSEFEHCFIVTCFSIVYPMIVVLILVVFFNIRRIYTIRKQNADLPRQINERLSG